MARLPAVEQAVQAGYYASFQRTFGARMQRLYGEQVRETEAIVRAAPGLRLLEIGCGLGTESLWFAQLGARVTALDVRPDRVAGAQARKDVLQAALGRPLDCSFTTTPVLNLPVEPYDLVWLEQAFHHLEPRAQVVPHLARLVAPGGHLVISEANAANRCAASGFSPTAPPLRVWPDWKLGWSEIGCRPC